MSFLHLFADDEKKKLQCGYCTNLLSVPGVTLPDQEGNLYACGRCSKIHGSTIPATAFEAIAPSIKFPCRYAMFGCNRQLSWGGVLDHEKSCDHRIYDCIVKQCNWQGSSVALKIHVLGHHKEIVIDDGCFKMPLTDMESLNIMFASNEIFLLRYHVRNSIFCLSVKYVGKPPECGRFTYEVEIKDVSSKKQNSIKIYNGKMKAFVDYDNLIISEKMDIEFKLDTLDLIFKTRNIKCCINVIEKICKTKTAIQKNAGSGNKETVEESSKESETSDKQKKTKTKETNKTVKDTASDASTSKQETKLNQKKNKKDANSKKPSSPKQEKKAVVPSSHIQETMVFVPSEKNSNKNNKDIIPDIQKPESSKKEEISIRTHQKNLQQEFECPVCNEYMFPPIYLCSLGHSICGDCKQKISECPTCSSPYGTTRNYSLESMLNLIHLPCRNEIHGCEFIGTMASLHAHKLVCTHDCVKCPIPYECKWVGTMYLLSIHLNNCHKTDSYVTVDEEITHNLTINEGSYKLIRFEENVFRISCKNGKKTNGFVKWSLQRVLLNKQRIPFKIEINFIDQTNAGRKFVINDVFRDFTEADKIFDDVLAIPLALLQPFIDSEQLLHFTYRIYL